jgi:hypothetical protein
MTKDLRGLRTSRFDLVLTFGISVNTAIITMKTFFLSLFALLSTAMAFVPQQTPEGESADQVIFLESLANVLLRGSFALQQFRLKDSTSVMSALLRTFCLI